MCSTAAEAEHLDSIDRWLHRPPGFGYRHK
jgi:hypothetical protein